MQKTLIVWLFTALVFVLFAVLNAAPVAVNLLFGTAQVSLAIVVVFPLFLGAVSGYTLEIVSRMKGNRRVKELEKQLAGAETELADLRTKALAAQAQATTTEPFPAR